jgi:hypothetical protein
VGIKRVTKAPGRGKVPPSPTADEAAQGVLDVLRDEDIDEATLAALVNSSCCKIIVVTNVRPGGSCIVEAEEMDRETVDPEATLVTYRVKLRKGWDEGQYLRAFKRVLFAASSRTHESRGRDVVTKFLGIALHRPTLKAAVREFFAGRGYPAVEEMTTKQCHELLDWANGLDPDDHPFFPMN